MKNFVFLSVFFLAAWAVSAVNTADIESVRGRLDGTSSEVSSTDEKVIRSFWENALNTMLLATESQEVVEIRRQVEQQKSKQPLCSYAAAYNAAAVEFLKVAFTNAGRIQEPARQQMIEQNLMILTANLQTPVVAPIAIERISDKDTVVRYWAVKATTNAGVIQTLSDEIMGDDATKVAILTALRQRIEFERQPEIQGAIIQFCAAINHPKAREILLFIADQRMAQYMDWSVQDPQVDIKLLNALGSLALMQSDTDLKAEFAAKFASLFSLVFQRYQLGQEVLTETQMEQTIAVVAEVNNQTLKRMLNISQTGIIIAMRQQRGLERVYEKIFGDRMRAGDLATIFNFDYGKDSDGNPVTAPPVLAAPTAG